VEDWRADNAKHTRGAILYFRKYSRHSDKWDHDHCEGCWAKFMERSAPDALVEGYVTEDGRRWVCSECFRDLKDVMDWQVVASPE